MREEPSSDLRSSIGFQHFQFTDADFAVIEQLSRGAPHREDLFRVVRFMEGNHVGSFANILLLYAAAGCALDCSAASRSIEVLRDWFVHKVNSRLQTEVYKMHLLTNSLPVDRNHEDIIASLIGTRADAQMIVDCYDWHWLADWLRLDLIGEDAASCVKRLSNFAFPIRRVNCRLTYHCNISCRHCYNSSGPHHKAEHISLDRMLGIVAQMPRTGIPLLNLTGGEPFLYLHLVTELIAAGRLAGLRGISIYTNGYWAATSERVDRILKRLVAAGFMSGPRDYLKVSTGVYHLEFIGFDRVLTLARRYYAMFGRRLLIDFETGPDSTGISDWARRCLHNAGIADAVDLAFRPILPYGRGKDLNGIRLHSIDSPCNVIDQIVFDPDGSVRPCCGFNSENQGVVIGRLGNDSLEDLVKRMQNDPILQFFAKNPMREIFKYLDVPRLSGYSGSCHLCQQAIGGLINKEPLQATLCGNQEYYPFWFALSGRKGRMENGRIASPFTSPA